MWRLGWVLGEGWVGTSWFASRWLLCCFCSFAVLRLFSVCFACFCRASVSASVLLLPVFCFASAFLLLCFCGAFALAAVLASALLLLCICFVPVASVLFLFGGYWAVRWLRLLDSAERSFDQRTICLQNEGCQYFHGGFDGRVINLSDT